VHRLRHRRVRERPAAQRIGEDGAGPSAHRRHAQVMNPFHAQVLRLRRGKRQRGGGAQPGGHRTRRDNPRGPHPAQRTRPGGAASGRLHLLGLHQHGQCDRVGVGQGARELTAAVPKLQAQPAQVRLPLGEQLVVQRAPARLHHTEHDADSNMATARRRGRPATPSLRGRAQAVRAGVRSDPRSSSKGSLPGGARIDSGALRDSLGYVEVPSHRMMAF